MSVALFVVFLTTFFCLTDQKSNSNRGLILSALVIIIYGGLRYGYGSDYPSYLRGFLELTSYSFSDDLSNIRTEVGWNYLNILCQPIGFFGMIIVLTIFETIVIYRFIGKYVAPKYHWIANICYTLNTNMMLLGFSMMRQFLAMCLFLLAIDYIIKKKWFIAVIIVLIAGLFHVTAFVLIPFCFVGYLGEIKKNNTWPSFFTLFILFMYFFGGPIFENILPDVLKLDVFNDYGDELGNEDRKSMFSLARVYEAGLFVSLMFVYRRLNSTERSLGLLYSASYLLASLITIVSLAGRINLYFGLVGLAAIPFIIKYLSDKRVRIGFLSLYIVFLFYRFIVFFNEPIWESFVHYYTILEQPWQ